MDTQILFKISQLERDRLCVITGHRLKTLAETKEIDEKILQLKCEMDLNNAGTYQEKKKIYLEYEENLKLITEEFYEKCRQVYEEFHEAENEIFERRREIKEEES